MKSLITLGIVALAAATSVLVVNAQSSDATKSALDGFMIGDARYAVEARFSMTKTADGSEALLLDVTTSSLRIAPVFIEARKPALATVTVDGVAVLTAKDENGVLQGTIPADTLAKWLGSEHDFRLEVHDAGGEVLLYGALEDSTISG
ncbi:MAG: hypothetical protein IT453_17970 [Planctomycetes bacterium]|nr:hypothetical protein [Planctomycetota bacterium]